jgi:hypothetical protein
MLLIFSGMSRLNKVVANPFTSQHSSLQQAVCPPLPCPLRLTRRGDIRPWVLRPDLRQNVFSGDVEPYRDRPLGPILSTGPTWGSSYLLSLYALHVKLQV